MSVDIDEVFTLKTEVRARSDGSDFNGYNISEAIDRNWVTSGG